MNWRLRLSLQEFWFWGFFFTSYCSASSIVRMTSTTNFVGLLFSWLLSFCLSFLFLLIAPAVPGCNRKDVSSCSSAGSCKLDRRAGPLHGTQGGRGGGEVHLVPREAVTDSVVAKECGIARRWPLGVAVMGVLKCSDWFLVAIEILPSCFVLLSRASSPSLVVVGDAVLVLQMPVIPCLCHYCRKTWRWKLWSVKYLRLNEKTSDFPSLITMSHLFLGSWLFSNA